MNPRPRLAFYCPMKPPDHPIPSGDRTMARLLRTALGNAGFAVDVASAFRAYLGQADEAAAGRMLQAGEAEAERLLAAYRAAEPADRPRLWFTYHVYYKAPDLLGPGIARSLGIPYVIAEASRAPKRAAGPWSTYHAAAEAAIDAADLVVNLNPNDVPLLERLRPPRQRLIDLPPFIDAGAWPQYEHTPPGPVVRLLTVAMMRHGDKLASYRLLAESLTKVEAVPWQIDVIGDGEARPAVEADFATFGDRVRFHGAITDHERLAAAYSAADLLVWPAVNEAFGMVFLEAALQGCPAVAGRFGGVSAVVHDGETGILTKPGDAADFAAALSKLLADPARLAALGRSAAKTVRAVHALEAAAWRLHEALAPLAVTMAARP